MELATQLKRLEPYSHSNKYADRIYNQLLYLYHMNHSRHANWEPMLAEAIVYLWDSIHENGSIVKEDCENLELALAGLSPAAKEITIHCVAHAHIDMNWQWGYQETISVATETFRTMLRLMEEYPEFTFSQSQAAVYEMVEKYDPTMLGEIRRRVQEGRWELSASTWVEADKNMANGESQCRQIYYTKQYLARLFQINPDSLRLNFEPDTFGHSVHVPEILQNGGVDYFYHCRGTKPPKGPYIWKAPSGKSVLAYQEPSWYQGPINNRDFAYYPQFGAKMADGTLTEFLKVYGVGDHGGGPSRLDIERILDMMSWPLYPTLKFSRYDTYFSYLDSVRHLLPEFSGELNFVFTGCYTSQSRIKMANRKAELRLYDAELLDAAAVTMTHRPSSGKFTTAWHNTLFNQFHDILPGSGTIETREAALGLFQETLGYTNTAASNALRTIAEEIDTSSLPYDDSPTSRSEGAGAGFHVDRERAFGVDVAEQGRGKIRIFHLFNTTPYARKEVTSLQIWDYPDDIGNLEAIDSSGKSLPLQLSEGQRGYWNHQYCTVLVTAEIPALGYTTIVIRQREAVSPSCLELPGRPDRRQDTFGDQNIVLENERIRAEFDAQTCLILSLKDKLANLELLPDHTTGAGGFRLVHENPRFGHSSWTRGPSQRTDCLNQIGNVHITDCKEQGLCRSLTYDLSFGERSTMTVTVRLYSQSTVLDYDIHVNWLEVGDNSDSPLLTFWCPAGYSVKNCRYETANGVVERPLLPHDVPSLCRMELLPQEENPYLQLMADTKYGFRGWNNEGEIALIQASFQPDLYPELGQHHFHTAIAIVENGNDAQRTGDFYNHEVIPVSATGAHEGILPLTASFFRWDNADNLSLSGARVADDGALTLRIYNRSAQETQTTLRFSSTIQSAAVTDIAEKHEIPLTFEGCNLPLDVPAYATVTVKVILTLF